MLTANALMGADRKYLEDGFDDYLSKPIHPTALENMVIKHLPEELIQSVDKSQTETVTTNEDLLQRLSFLDTDAGLQFAAGDFDFYKQILDKYVKDDKCESLEKFYQEKDWDNYRIIAHSIKGTSLTIGAPEVSEAAKGLEFAAKENRIEYIDEHHSEVKKEYSNLITKIKKAVCV